MIRCPPQAKIFYDYGCGLKSGYDPEREHK